MFNNNNRKRPNSWPRFKIQLQSLSGYAKYTYPSDYLPLPNLQKNKSKLNVNKTRPPMSAL